MMKGKCLRCGFVNHPDTKVCSQCGYQMIPDRFTEPHTESKGYVSGGSSEQRGNRNEAAQQPEQNQAAASEAAGYQSPSQNTNKSTLLFMGIALLLCILFFFGDSGLLPSTLLASVATLLLFKRVQANPAQNPSKKNLVLGFIIIWFVFFIMSIMLQQKLFPSKKPVSQSTTIVAQESQGGTANSYSNGVKSNQENVPQTDVAQESQGGTANSYSNGVKSNQENIPQIDYRNYSVNDSYDTSKSEEATSARECGSCNGSGECHVCGGEGTFSCNGLQCIGGECSACDGTGLYDHGTRVSRCIVCDGDGICNICNGTNRFKCSICHGNGKCTTCGGKGTR